MSRQNSRPASRRHILVYDEDWEWLMEHFGPMSGRPFGVGPSIREIVHKHVNGLRTRVQERIDGSGSGNGGAK